MQQFRNSAERRQAESRSVSYTPLNQHNAGTSARLFGMFPASAPSLRSPEQEPEKMNHLGCGLTDPAQAL